MTADPTRSNGGANLPLRAYFTAPPRLTALYAVQIKRHFPFGRRSVSYVTMGNTELIQDVQFRI